MPLSCLELRVMFIFFSKSLKLLGYNFFSHEPIFPLVLEVYCTLSSCHNVFLTPLGGKLLYHLPRSFTQPLTTFSSWNLSFYYPVKLLLCILSMKRRHFLPNFLYYTINLSAPTMITFVILHLFVKVFNFYLPTPPHWKLCDNMTLGSVNVLPPQ